VGLGANGSRLPKHCSFCSVWRTDGQRPRQRSSDAVIEEIVELRRLGFRFIALADDNFYPVTLSDLRLAAQQHNSARLHCSIPADSSKPRTTSASDSCSQSNTLTSFSLGSGRLTMGPPFASMQKFPVSHPGQIWDISGVRVPILTGISILSPRADGIGEPVSFFRAHPGT
jgi:hypothetical protein